MTTPVTSNTFLSNYNDDYADSDHYHRILFNNGRALQARELTQMQTIINKEMARIAGFIFKEGGMFDTSPGAIFSGGNAVDFVKLSSSLPTGYAALVGTVITNAAGVTAVIKAAIAATGSDPATLLVAYQSSNSLQSANTAAGPRIFNAGDTLTYTPLGGGTLTVQTTNTSANPATGQGSMVEVSQFNTFVAGHIIMVESQSLVVSKYSARPNAIIGFELSEDIVTTADDIALYDNSGSTPNLTSPGADRYRITMTLIDKTNATGTFYPIYELRQGVPTRIASSDNLLAELGNILASRTNDITGNFIVPRSGLGAFDLQIVEDSDTDYLRYKVGSGIAFINGNRVSMDKPTDIRVEKPRDAINDTTTKTNQFIPATYGNYFVADSAYGIVSGIDTLEELEFYSAVDRGGVTIGTARLRNVDYNSGKYRIHIFDLKMDSAAGVPYNLSAVRSIGYSAADYANIQPGRSVDYTLVDKLNSNLLFPLPVPRVQNVSSVTMKVADVYTTTSNGSGSATFSTGSTNTFTNLEDWIVKVDSSGELFTSPSFSGTPTTSAVVTGLPTSSAVSALGYENITAVKKVKTLQTNVSASGVSLSNRRFTIPYHDIYKFRSIVDDTTSENITSRFKLDTGHHDDFYTIGSGELKAGYPTPSSTITITFDYFTHSAGDYFAGMASYPDIEYENIPYHRTKTGQLYRLSDVIDMRPKKANDGRQFVGSGAVIERIPKNTDTITIGTVSYWNSRSDLLYLNPRGYVDIKKGTSELMVPTTLPTIGPDEMPLYNIRLNPYVVNTRDVKVEPYKLGGYKMRDIGSLEDRINTLENAVTLNAAEIKNISTTIPDPYSTDNRDRVKTGLTADAFRNNIQSAVYDDDFRSTVNTISGVVHPLVFDRGVTLYYDSDLSTNTILKNGYVWPKYSEEVLIDQSLASKAIDVAQYVMTTTVGTGKLLPQSNTWTREKKVDEGYQGNISATTTIVQGTMATSSQGEQTTK